MVNTAPLSTKRGERSGGSSRNAAVGVFIGRTYRSAPTVDGMTQAMTCYKTESGEQGTVHRFQFANLFRQAEPVLQLLFLAVVLV